MDSVTTILAALIAGCAGTFGTYLTFRGKKIQAAHAASNELLRLYRDERDAWKQEADDLKARLDDAIEKIHSLEVSEARMIAEVTSLRAELQVLRSMFVEKQI